MTSYIGRGLDDIAGKPFGWAWHQERDEIRAHLRRRIWKFGLDGKRAMRLEARISQIQNRLHRNRPSYAERCAARAASRPAYVPPPTFNADELMRMVEHFDGANDPVSAAIAIKARELLAL